MHRLFIFAFLIVFGFAACNNANQNASAPEVATASKHSAAFNQSVQAAMDVYYKLTEAFVNWDSVKATSLATTLTARLDSLPMNEINKNLSADSSKAQGLLDSSKKDIAGMIAATDITTKRHALNAFSDRLFQFLNTVQYDRQKLYLQECPMAFNDQDPGHWVSDKEAIRNPYLGLHHPYYKSGMIECGETKQVMNYTEAK